LIFLIILNTKGKLYHFQVLKTYFCPYFSYDDFVKTIKRLANNAHLACKRCPFEALLSTFLNLFLQLVDSKKLTGVLKQITFSPSLTGKIIFHKFSGCFV